MEVGGWQERCTFPRPTVVADQDSGGFKDFHDFTSALQWVTKSTYI